MKHLFKNGRLARRMGLYIILTSTIITLIMSSIQIYVEFSRDKNTAISSLALIEKTNLTNIATQVWVTEIEVLKITLLDLLNLPSMQYIAVYENKKLIADAGIDSNSNSIKKTFPLIRKEGNNKFRIGTLVAKVSLDGAYNNIYSRAILIISSNIFKTLIIAFLIIFIFYRLVARHLFNIADFANEIDSHSLKDRIILNRKENLSTKQDELDILLNGFSNMQQHLDIAIQNLKEREKNLNVTLNSIGDAVIATDEKGNVTSMNPVAENLTGWSLQEAQGQFLKTIFPIINTSTREPVENPVDKVIATGETIYLSNHTTLISKDGTEYQIADSAAPIKDNGHILGMVLVFNDVTEKYLKDEKLRRSQKMDALGKMSGGIAHDYNNMMGIVLGYSELLLSQVVNDEEAVDYVVQIRNAGERARTLTSKLMAFSRNKLSEETVVSINKELENKKVLLEKMLTSRIQLNLDLDDDLWAVHFDSGDFNDAIINMTINACHAIESAGNVNISTNNVYLDVQEAKRFDLTEGYYVRVLFSDSGKGMGAEIVSKIFDPFFSTKGEQGTGLGMSQVYGFVTRSDGAIVVNSELNRGTELVFYFPRYDDSDSEQKIIESTTKNTSNPSHETILVVDDEEVLCNLAKKMLTNQGYHVLLAFSGAQALEILKTERVNIVFSDVIMPEMTGYELATIISDKYPNILIQLTSGYTGDEKFKLHYNLSNFDVLDKPYASSELLNKITALLNKK